MASDPSRISLLKNLNKNISDEDIKEELAEVITSSYSHLTNKQALEIEGILYQGVSDRIKRVSILAICNG